MTLLLPAALLGLWLLLVAAFVVLGRWVLPGDAGRGWPSAHLSFWMGVSIVNGTLLLWHLALPVAAPAAWVFGLAAIAAAIRGRHEIAAWIHSIPRWTGVAAALAIGLWLANHALGPGGMDDYAYEYQAVRWTHDYAIVPGLANLHGRLGFNQSHHLLAALLSTGLGGEVHHVLNGLFVLVTIVYLAAGIRLVSSADGPMRASWLVRAVLAGPALGLALFGTYGPALSTLKADVLVACCVMVLAGLWIEMLERDHEAEPIAAHAAVILGLCSLAVSVKLTALVFCGVLAAATVAVLSRRARVQSGTWRHAWPGVVLALLVGVLVPLRGTVLTGYPAYPSTLLGAAVDWRVPEAQAAAERAYVTSFAQLRPTFDPSAVSGWSWVGKWTRSVAASDRFTLLLPLALALACAPASWSRAFGHKARDPRSPGWAVLFVACAAALGTWFAMAPAPRFATGYAWAMAAAAVGWSCAGWASRARRAAGVACVCLAVFPPAERLAAHAVRGRSADAAALFWLQGTRHGGVEEYPGGYPGPADAPVRTRSGLVVTSARVSTFGTPLPNSRYVNEYLEARVPGSLGSGFRVSRSAGMEGPGYALPRWTPAAGATP